MDVLTQILTVVWQREFYEVKNNLSLFLLRKILFAIKQSKFELEHPNLGSVRLLSGALGDSCSTFDCFMSKYIL